MNSEEFFKKLGKGEFEGEGLGYIHDVVSYLRKPDGNKIYNITSKYDARNFKDLINRKYNYLEARVAERKKDSGRIEYQVGIFYNPKEHK